MKGIKELIVGYEKSSTRTLQILDRDQYFKTAIQNDKDTKPHTQKQNKNEATHVIQRSLL